MKSLDRVCGAAVLACLLLSSTFASEGGAARTFWWKVEYLELAKQKWRAGDETIAPAMARVISGANTWKSRGPFSVMDKDEIPPSGDKHDFLSYGSYYWPNPDTEDGLPWIRRDGYVNPGSSVDFGALSSLRHAMLYLSLAYYLTDDESYAEHAAYLLRVFFLDEATLMYPRTYYSQMVPGLSPGTCEVVGIANTFQFILEGAGILERSPAWSQADKQGLQKWCRDYLDFMEAEAICYKERTNTANHGSNYDFLAALLALYIGDEVTARAKILNYIEHRMPGQISADGSNPLEMGRADNLLYHCYNLNIIFRLASLGDNFDDIDLWNYKMKDGRGPALALEFLVPYMTGQKQWAYWPGEPFAPTIDRYFLLLRHGAVAYNSFRLEKYARALNYGTYFFNVVYPWFAITPACGDFEPDGDVDMHDLAILASAWLSTAGDDHWNPPCDISDPKDDVVNMLDLTVLADNWLDYR